MSAKMKLGNNARVAWIHDDELGAGTPGQERAAGTMQLSGGVSFSPASPVDCYVHADMTVRHDTTTLTTLHHDSALQVIQQCTLLNDLESWILTADQLHVFSSRFANQGAGLTRECWWSRSHYPPHTGTRCPRYAGKQTEIHSWWRLNVNPQLKEAQDMTGLCWQSRKSPDTCAWKTQHKASMVTYFTRASSGPIHCESISLWIHARSNTKEIILNFDGLFSRATTCFSKFC